MEYSEALEKIAGLDDGADILDAVKGKVSKANSEAYNLRHKLRTFDNVDLDRYKKSTDVLDSLEANGFDLDGNVGDQISALKTDGSKANDELSRVMAKVNRLEQEATEQKSLAERLKNEGIQKEIKNQLMEHKEKILSAPAVIGYHLNDFGLDDNGKAFYKDGDENVLVSDGGIDRFLNRYPDYVRNSQQGGSGSGGSGNTNQKTMTRAAFEALSPADRMAKALDKSITIQ